MMLIRRGCWLRGLCISLATDVVPIYQVINQSIILAKKKKIIIKRKKCLEI